MAELPQEIVVPCAIVAFVPVLNKQLHYWEMWLLNNVAMTDIQKNKTVCRFCFSIRKSISEKFNRQIQRFVCKENRIDGAMNINRVWLIPKTAKKPADGRYKINKEQKE